VIKVDALTVRYPGASQDTLSGLTLTFPDKGVVALMGANGSGKSTLVRALAGLLTPTSGSVQIDGLSTTNAASLAEVRRRVGVVFQNPAWQMTSLTVERELAFGLENHGVARPEMQAKVDDYLRRYKLGSRRSAPPWALSAGEQQRVALAATAILEPAYLFLDEATSLLSPPSRRELMKTVDEERTHRFMLLVTQFPEEALPADRLVVFDQGRVVADGPPREVFRDAARLEALGVPVPLEMVFGVTP
jgi:energy-coupling factor transport system ATP-binding protein